MVIDAFSGRKIITLSGHGASQNEKGYYGNYSMAFSPDSSKLATFGLYHLIKVWDLKSGRELVRFNSGFVGRRGSQFDEKQIAWYQNGTKLISLTINGVMGIWKLPPLN